MWGLSWEMAAPRNRPALCEAGLSLVSFTRPDRRRWTARSTAHGLFMSHRVAPTAVR